MRVVIDVNVFVSSFFGGHPRRVIDLWKSGDIVLCLSAEIVDEYAEVLDKADAIITGDKALRAIRSYVGIKILDPGDFPRLIEPKPGV